jgi:hypothetical protein
MKVLEQQIEKGLDLLEEAVIQERVIKLKPQLDKMRAAYGSLERVNPTGATYTKLKAKLAAMSVNDLQILYAAKIKWMSYEAGMILKGLGVISGAVNMDY